MGHGDQGGFGDLLRRYRAASGMTQEELAERAGLSVRGISDLERGERTRPHRETVAMLADALALSPDDRGALLAAARMPDARDPGVASPAPVPTNLPVSPTPLIGRAEDIAAAAQLLARGEVRLVNLTGPGGVGKTRLAIEVARNGAGDFPDGVFFVPLAAFHDPGLVIPAIGRTLGIQDTGGQPLRERIVASVREKRLLLVLDNFEHLLAAAPLVSDLLAASANLNVLVTSRAVLHLSGEYEFAVAPLALPDRTHPSESATLVRYPAIQLFVERAQAVSADFAMTDINAAAVAEICVRLDGLPLAIELAAARVKVLPPLAMLARLRKPLHLLTDGARDLPARQRTLRQTIAWSHDLLEPGEQALFRRLAVFVGGWTLEAAEAVQADNDDAGDALDALASLLDKNLVRSRIQANGAPRFTMLETLREFALEQLDAHEETEGIRRQHAAYFLALAEAGAAKIWGAEQETWLPRLGQEQDNLRAALAWSLASPHDREIGLRLAGALGWFWFMYGEWSQGRRWLEHALAANPDAPPDVRARALNLAGNLANRQGDAGSGIAAIEESLALCRALGDTWGTAFALNNLGMGEYLSGNYARATALFEEALPLNRAVGDVWQTARALGNLGLVTHAQGDAARTVALHEEALALARQVGNKAGIAWSLTILGEVARDQGNDARAREMFEEALALCRQLGHKWRIGAALHNLGHIALRQQDTERAAVCFTDRLMLAHELGDKPGIARCLMGLAAVAIMREIPERAARLYGAADAIRSTRSTGDGPVVESDKGERRTLALIRAALDDAQFATAWEEGRTFSLDQAIAEAQDTSRSSPR